jgi:dihydroflavonol-4-reductase
MAGSTLLHAYSLEVLKSNSHISHAKATRELGYHPRKLYESIADAVQWFLEAGKTAFNHG